MPFKMPYFKALKIAADRGAYAITGGCEAGRDTGADSTPVDTSKGQKSWHAKVYVNGKQVAGDDVDGNGNPTPDYAGTQGLVTGVVATNEGADDGKWYLHYVDRGVRGRAGVQMKAQARAAMIAEIRERLK